MTTLYDQQATLPTHDRDIPESPEPVFPRKHSLFGVQVSATNYAEVVEVLIAAAKLHRPTLVDFAPANVVVEAADNPAFRRKINEFDLVCPDGQPVRWALNYLHKAGLKDRVYGPFTTLYLCEAAARAGVSVYLYGASPETLEKFQAKLLQKYPNLIIAGAESPPFRPLTPEEDAAAIDRINASGAGLVFLGIGSPRQEHFAWDHKPRINAVLLCVGAAFDFIAGTKKMARPWMQKRGLEWLCRLCTELRRLGKRYVMGNVRFVTLTSRQTVKGHNPNRRHDGA